MQSVQTSHLQARALVLKCHPSRSDIVSLGLDNGQVFFMKLGNQETYVLNAHEESDQMIVDQTGNAPSGMKILDIAWDP